ncbi:nucleoside recognition domain-containing protein [Methanogenium organophilum]|uniref:Nucleoside recognition protein n=1 Tax=Methanogenium organophilum TaxID=2199 RepID=A0A9X9S618_METOG|nr:nucleoside recognition domain-containing protein [Methanogenium organophilum]WAI02341.1 nucleoside recognition protein [Methanogenium organophilum]
MNTFFQETTLLALSLLARTIPMMVAGVIAAELILAFNATERLSRYSRPLTVWSNLHHECGISFMMAFISPKAANAMLAKYHRDGTITRREMVIAALMNSFPNVMMHWRYLLPVYVPLLGLIGLIYFAILVVVGIIKTMIVMVAGRWMLPAPHDTENKRRGPVPRPTWKDGVHTALKASAASLRHILIISVPTILIVAVFINLGFFDLVADQMQGIGSWFPVPTPGFAIIAAQFGSFIASASVASTLLAAGTLSPQEIIITLLVGNILTSVTRAIRWYGTSYAAIFGPRNGALIQGLSTGLRVVVMIGVVALLSLIW